MSYLPFDNYGSLQMYSEEQKRLVTTVLNRSQTPVEVENATTCINVHALPQRLQRLWTMVLKQGGSPTVPQERDAKGSSPLQGLVNGILIGCIAMTCKALELCSGEYWRHHCGYPLYLETKVHNAKIRKR